MYLYRSCYLLEMSFIWWFEDITILTTCAPGTIASSLIWSLHIDHSKTRLVMYLLILRADCWQLFLIQTSYYLLELCAQSANTFDIVVPLTSSGIQLLCNIVDNVEALVDEWFPGLRDLSPYSDAELIKPMSLCPLCPCKQACMNQASTCWHNFNFPFLASSKQHRFMLKDLLHFSVTVDEVECPVHKGTVKLEQLVANNQQYF